jgi:hypothetical protein
MKASAFFNARNPLSSLACVGLLVMASGRLAFAVTVAFALLWVYSVTTLVVFAANPLLPKHGRLITFVFLSSFITSLLFVLLWLFSPFLMMSCMYLVALVPCCFIGSNILKESTAPRDADVPRRTLLETVSAAFFEALILGGVTIGMALIREPIGYMALSLPGGPQGLIEVFGHSQETDFLPVQVLAGSAGAFLLLGYLVALFSTIKRQYVSTDHSGSTGSTGSGEDI